MKCNNCGGEELHTTLSGYSQIVPDLTESPRETVGGVIKAHVCRSCGEAHVDEVSIKALVNAINTYWRERPELLP